MDGDARSFRVALVADEFLNPPPGGLDALAVLERIDWGAMQFLELDSGEINGGALARDSLRDG